MKALRGMTSDWRLCRLALLGWLRHPTLPLNGRGVELTLLAGGALLTVVSAMLLGHSGDLRPHGNPFALRRSGYGMILARLSQDTVNKVWHYGLEEANPHEDHACDHNCDHDHDHADEPGGNPDHGQDHDRGPAHASLPSAPAASAPAPAYGSDPGSFPRDLRSVAGLPEGAASPGEPGFLQSAMDAIQDLKAAKYRRTNPHGLTEAHKKKVARDIENLLLRSYLMDPTDYGVYNSYYLFLTIHELRASQASLEQAKRVAGLTIAAAQQETETPFPWLTAASALLDQFFIDQQKARTMGIPVPASALRDYAARIAECLARYSALRDAAEARGDWEGIGQARRVEAEERYLFLARASRQFENLLREAPASSGNGVGR